MSVIRSFLRFWYDFIIGDDWRIAAGVAVALGLGAALVALGPLSDEAITLIVLSVVVFGLVVSFLAETRR